MQRLVARGGRESEASSIRTLRGRAGVSRGCREIGRLTGAGRAGRSTGMENVEGEGFILFLGEALEALRELPDESVDSICTDPPAGIEFMGKAWDHDHGGRDEWIAEYAVIFRECLRVLKPGAHGLVWSLPRTSHWTATALEDAGFEIRGEILHLFAVGFAKSMAIDKAIDKAAGAVREVVGRRTDRAATPKQDIRGGKLIGGESGAYDGSAITAPATHAAKQWKGFGTALAPSHENWILVRKPIPGTVAANVLEFGTGALNIDASRIGVTDGAVLGRNNKVGDNGWKNSSGGPSAAFLDPTGPAATGRFPKDTLLSHSPECVVVGAVVVAGDARDTGEPLGGARPGGFGDVGSERGTATPVGRVYGSSKQQVWACPPHCAVRQLDDQAGSRKSGAMKAGTKRKKSKGLGGYGDGFPDEANREEILPSSGYVSRFFYTGKVPPRERLLPDGTKSAHPTQKSVELMTYLTRLITPPGGVVLDPFLGSGTTGVAALACGFEFIGIERDEQYLAWAYSRINGGV